MINFFSFLIYVFLHMKIRKFHNNCGKHCSSIMVQLLNHNFSILGIKFLRMVTELKDVGHDKNSLRSRPLEVVGEREKGHTRGRCARGEGAPIFSSAHYFQAPAMQARIKIELRLI